MAANGIKTNITLVNSKSPPSRSYKNYEALTKHSLEVSDKARGRGKWESRPDECNKEDTPAQSGPGWSKASQRAGRSKQPFSQRPLTLRDFPNVRTVMGRTTCLLLLLSSLWSVILCAPQHQYVLVTTPKSWYDAQSYCREKYLDLATISDTGEMTMVLTAVEDKYDDAVWTGLYKGTTLTWHWSLADNDFYKDGERDYFIWGNNTNYNCGGFKDGKLYVVGCTLPYPSICFDGRQQGLQQYVLINQTMIWIDARDYCRTYYTDLVSVRSADESQMLQQVVGDLQVWTGLFRDPWIWSDQTYSSFRYWRPSEAVYTDSSTLPCAAMLKSESGKWGELSCDEAHPFLCSFISGTITRVKVRISSQESALDPNEPVAQNNVLEQIKQMLTNTNAIHVTHLKWMKNPDGSVFIKDVSAGGSSKSCSASDLHL